MTETLPFHVYDVFTDRPYTGNPLAIVEAAGGLGPAQMQAIAREFNLSETIFVRPPADPAHAASVRIFLPGAEIPFAGHPTLGCAVHLATAGRGAEDFATRLVLEEVAGLVPVEVTRTGGRIAAWFVAPVLPEPAGPPPSDDRSAAALGLAAAAIGFGAHGVAAWRGGPGFLYVPVAGLAALADAAPRADLLSAALAGSGATGAYLYAPLPDGAGFRARMFAPGAGVAEDPATGSATAILSGQLLAAGSLGEGETAFRLEQGIEMGRPSALALRVRVAGGALAEVRVGGSAVPVASGRLRPPAA